MLQALKVLLRMQLSGKKLVSAICTLVLFCGWQAYYYPLIIKPGTIIEWWQIKWAADLGIFLALPAFVVPLKVSLGNIGGQVVFWLGLFVWVSALYCTLTKLLFKSGKHRSR